MKNRFLYMLLLIVGVVIGGERQAHAMMYTDPGSGALLWQLGVSAFLGLMFYVSKIGTWIGQKFRKVEQPIEASEPKA